VLLACVALSAVLVAGCDDAGASPAKAPTEPAAAAGGACQLLDFGIVNTKLGTNLSVAAGATEDNTFTCVLQPSSTGYPDLILSVSSTTIGPDVFGDMIQPKDAESVSGLGLAGYQMTTPPVDKAGPGVEVGWLAGNKRIIQLSFRFAPGTPDQQATDAKPKLVELAKLIDLSSL
jgi:hypothetical protein